MVGIEPTTYGLRNRCSTTELHWPLIGEVIGAKRDEASKFPETSDWRIRALPRMQTGRGAAFAPLHLSQDLQANRFLCAHSDTEAAGQPLDNADTDGNGLPDSWENTHGTDRLVGY